MIPKASENLYAYKQWLDSLTALPAGTIFHWPNGYQGATLSSTLKPGQYTKIVRVRKSNGIRELPVHAQVYEMLVCSKAGKEFKKSIDWRVEGMARKQDEGNAVIQK